MSEIIDLFQHNRILDGLTSKQLNDLSECAEVSSYSPGDRLIEQGKRADKFFIIQSGKVSIEVYSPQRGPKPIQEVAAGSLLGSSSWMEPHKWQFDARAIEPTQALVFNAKLVQEKCNKDAELSAALLKRFFIAVAARLDAAQRQLLDMFANKP